LQFKKVLQAFFFKGLINEHLIALKRMNQKNGAGDGNRTHMASLEGWSFTTKLHPLST
jgi:hypothetical protein